MKIIHAELSRDFETVEVYSLSDLHIGSQFVDLKLFDRFIKNILDAPNRFIIYNGDNMNNAIKSSISNIYAETMRPRDQKRWLIENLEPVKDRILAFTEGNHEARSAKETDQSIVEDIAYALGRHDVYRGDEALIKITFGKNKKNRKRQCYSLWCTHGSGGGGTIGATMNKLQRVAMGTDADVYLTGHVHQKATSKNCKRSTDLKNNSISTRERLFVISSHFMNFGGYAAKGMMLPSAKGSVKITFHAKEKKIEATI